MNPFNVGDQIVCIKRPEAGTYQCKVGARAIVSVTSGTNIQTVEDICDNWGSSSSQHAWYSSKFFKLDKPTISFKDIIRSS